MNRDILNPQQVVTFFKNHPLAQHQGLWISPDPLRPQGIFSSLRANSFDAKYLNISQKQGYPWIKLRMRVYEVSTTPGLSAVIAQDIDGSLLWLDDDFQDDDFSIFTHREELYLWSTDQLNELVNILIETKCAYLGLPRLISKINDVPGLATNDEMDIQLTYQINKPQILHITPTEIRVTAYIWTYLFGKIYHITWVISKDQKIKYTGKLLFDHLGDYLAPR